MKGQVNTSPILYCHLKIAQYYITFPWNCMNSISSKHALFLTFCTFFLVPHLQIQIRDTREHTKKRVFSLIAILSVSPKKQWWLLTGCHEHSNSTLKSPLRSLLALMWAAARPTGRIGWVFFVKSTVVWQGDGGWHAMLSPANYLFGWRWNTIMWKLCLMFMQVWAFKELSEERGAKKSKGMSID